MSNIKKEIVDLLIEETLNGTIDSSRHCMTLFSLVLSLKPKVVVELGVRDGKSTLPLLCGSVLVGAHLYSVDKEDTNFICPKDLRDNWSFHRLPAETFLFGWGYNSKCIEVMDLVYVDDWHSYEHVKKELEYLDKYVSPGSVILLHDLMYCTEPHYHSDLTLKGGQWAGGGPYRAVAELDPNFWEFATIPVGNGLTVLRKKYSSKYHK